MTDTIRSRISAAIVLFLEPQIQTLITDRILLFRAKLIEQGLALDLSAGGNKRPNPSSPIAGPPSSIPDQHG